MTFLRSSVDTRAMLQHSEIRVRIVMEKRESIPVVADEVQRGCRCVQ